MSRPRSAAHALVFLSALLTLLFSGRPATQGSVYFSENFNTSNTNYNFGGKYPEGSWTVTHQPTGGWNGSGAPRIVMRAGQTQYSFGYWTRAFGHTFTMGEGVYIRFRIKYDANMRGTDDWGNKFILMGNVGTVPNSRLIVYMQTVGESLGCSLGMRNWNASGNPVYPWALPNHFGISESSFLNIRANAWSLAPYVNIGWDCAPPIFQTVPSNPHGGRPGPSNSAVAVNGWTHVQIYAQSGNAGQGQFKVWANNNNVSSPSSQQLGLAGGLGVNGWGDGATIGGFMDNATPSVDLGYTIDDLEFGSAFNSGWYPGGGVSTPPPAGPSGLRILSH